MATLQRIKKRIRSLESTQKMTRAMKQVAASKFRRAQQALVATRPFSDEIGALLHRLAATGCEVEVAHPLLQRRPLRRALMIVVTSDRGLCGSFNTNLLRAAELFAHQRRGQLEHLHLGTIGRKGYEHFTRLRFPSLTHYPDVYEGLTFRRASDIAESLSAAFLGHELDAVYLLYHEFKSAAQNRITSDQLLPIEPARLPAGVALGDYRYEPDRGLVLEQLVPRYVATQIWRVLLESTASEHGSRMVAMDAATKSAEDMHGRLMLQFNRARQESITRELLDVVGGAEAQQGAA